MRFFAATGLGVAGWLAGRLEGWLGGRGDDEGGGRARNGGRQDEIPCWFDRFVLPRLLNHKPCR